MKTNKISLMLTLFFFIFNTMVSPVAMANLQLKSKGTPVRKSLPIAHLFDSSMTEYEKELVSRQIEYVYASFPHREGLRKASEALIKELKSDRLWSSLKIKDKEMSELLTEANSGRRYLLDKTWPTESKLNTEQRKIENQLLKDQKQINDTGKVPDEFMVRLNGLSALYDAQDELWVMKNAMVFKILGISNNLYHNYILKNPGQFSQNARLYDQSLLQLKNAAGSAASFNRRLVQLKNDFQHAKDMYNKMVISEYTSDKKRSEALIQAIQQQTSLLEQKGTPNNQNHAKLLKNIEAVLEQRIESIDQNLGEFNTSKFVNSPFYIPEDLGGSESSRNLVNEYQQIAKEFIVQTEEKINRVETLSRALKDIQTTAHQEKLFFQTLVNNTLKIDNDEKKTIISRSDQVVGEFDHFTKRVEQQINAILNQAKQLNFKNPDSIIGDRIKSSIAFQINRDIESFISEAEEFNERSIKLDIAIYQLIAHLDLSGVEGLEPYKVLEESSLSRDRSVQQFDANLEIARDIVAADAVIAKALKDLSNKVIKTGYTFYKEKTQTLSSLLAKEKTAKGTSYYDYLTGVNEQLGNRLTILEKLVAVYNQYGGQVEKKLNCTTCINPSTIWSDMSELGMAFVDTLEQMDNLSDIETFYTSDKIRSTSLFVNAGNLFELNKKLGNEPFLKLNDNSIDVVFRAGSRMVFIKGIGDPGQISLAGVLSEQDYLFDQPHIGGWLSKITSAGKKWIKPIGQKLGSTASKFLTTVKTAGGKIYSVGSKWASKTFEGAKSLLKTVGHYGSKTLGFLGEWIGKTWENMLYEGKNLSLWKIAGYGLGIAGCIATGPGCVLLGLAVAIDAGKGMLDIFGDRKWITDKQKYWSKLVLDIGGIIAGGIVNIKAAGAAFSKMSSIKKLMVFLGMSLDDMKNINKLWLVNWSKIKSIKSILKVLKKLGDAAGAWKKIADYYFMVKDWLKGLPPGMPELPPFFGPLMPFPGFPLPIPGMPGFGGGGPGVKLPGQKIPGSPPGSGTSLSPGGNFINPNKDWVNPNKDWTNPNKDWTNPNKNWDNPNKNWKAPK